MKTNDLSPYFSRFQIQNGIVQNEKSKRELSATIDSFGDEWTRFTYSSESDFELAGAEYFDILPPNQLPKETVAVDVGCGTGRWARMVAPHVKLIFGVDPSSSLDVAQKNCLIVENFIPVRAHAESMPFKNESVDFAMSLGVLHHIPDTEGALREIHRVLKPGSKFLFYFYYNLENRPVWFKSIFWASNFCRLMISKLPNFLKNFVCELIAAIIYFPMVSICRILQLFGFAKLANALPLSAYSNKSYYVIRTDSRDRFGTPLEKRYSQQDITGLLESNGFKNIIFSKNQPFWHGFAVKK